MAGPRALQGWSVRARALWAPNIRGSFDVVCAFQVFDQRARPGGHAPRLLKDLRPGGMALFINHDTGLFGAAPGREEPDESTWSTRLSTTRRP